MKNFGNGAKVGNRTVFSPMGAIRAYKTFCEIFNKEMNMESCAVAIKAAEDMHNLGFSWEEIEEIELSAL